MHPQHLQFSIIRCGMYTPAVAGAETSDLVIATSVAFLITRYSLKFQIDGKRSIVADYWAKSCTRIAINSSAQTAGFNGFVGRSVHGTNPRGPSPESSYSQKRSVRECAPKKRCGSAKSAIDVWSKLPRTLSGMARESKMAWMCRNGGS